MNDSVREEQAVRQSQEQGERNIHALSLSLSHLTHSLALHNTTHKFWERLRLQSVSAE